MKTTNENIFFKQLKDEHEEVKDLFEKATEAKGKERTDILAKIKSHLIPHARAEEKTLYAALLDADTGTELESLVKEAYAEHHTADTILSELNKLSADDEMWEAKLTVLKENIEHHIEEEEEDLFPKANKWISKSLASEMLEAFKAEKKRFEESEPTQSQIKSKLKSDKLEHVTLR